MSMISLGDDNPVFSVFELSADLQMGKFLGWFRYTMSNIKT